LRFNVTSLAAKAGKVKLVMSNPSSLTHSIAIEGNGVTAAGSVVTQGGTSTVSANLRPGTYTFYCTVPGHREAGMQGTLTVQ
jgi:plastocyanin